jgi:hypothetical protein
MFGGEEHLAYCFFLSVQGTLLLVSLNVVLGYA